MRTKPKTWIYYESQARQQAIAAIKKSPRTEAIKARENLALFGEYISGFKPAPHHQEWLSAIQSNETSQSLNLIAGNNLRIAAPRGGAKTTWISIGIAWIIGHNPGIRIILCSYSETLALGISTGVKQYIESEKYQEIFPTIRKSRRWKDTAWFIDRRLAEVTRIHKDPTLLAVGSGGSIAGRRSDLIIIDDPIKSSEAIANKAIREAMVKWWSEVLEPTLTPGGRTIVLCTRYRVDDIHGTTFTHDNKWSTITQKAIITNAQGEEQSYWEEYITLKNIST